jgi:queuine/archaeosine tRNA-ribosyltransferase
MREDGKYFTEYGKINIKKVRNWKKELNLQQICVTGQNYVIHAEYISSS